MRGAVEAEAGDLGAAGGADQRPDAAGAGGDILDGAVGLAPNDAYLAGAGVDAAERSPDVAVLDAGDPGGAAGERDAERVGGADQPWHRERAAAARVEFVHAGLADEPDARAADGEIDEVAARARSRWHQQDDGNRCERKCDQANEAALQAHRPRLARRRRPASAPEVAAPVGERALSR